MLLIILSAIGLLAPAENIAARPVRLVSGTLNNLTLSFSQSTEELAQIRDLRARVALLEETLAQYQSELVELREIESDYERLAGLLDYTATRDDQEFVTADVIDVDQSGQLRTITVNRGTRDGIAVGMPVVTQQGLVGRVLNVSANASRVLLITDPTSAVSVRLQSNRVEGTILGQLSGNLRLTFVPLDEEIQEGDIVVTSGLGGNFPPDVVVGVVTSIRQFEFELYQEAQVRSLNSFDTLEFILIVTSFEPVDLSVFDEETLEEES
ncbi:MAG: rod shape-determining protein MreC [Chloroflexota bacterium]